MGSELLELEAEKKMTYWTKLSRLRNFGTMTIEMISLTPASEEALGV